MLRRKKGERINHQHVITLEKAKKIAAKKAILDKLRKNEEIMNSAVKKKK